MVTVNGVCTSVGLGVIQITAGLLRLEWINPAKPELNGVCVATIRIITSLATIFMLRGLKAGIKCLYVIGFFMGCLVVILTRLIYNQTSRGMSDKDYFLMSIFFIFDMAKYFLLLLFFVN